MTVIRTALMKPWFEDRSVATFMAASTPLVREDGLEQVANAAAFLASGEDAGWITGVPMSVDGGFTAQ